MFGIPPVIVIEDLSCRSFGQAQDRLRPVSIFTRAGKPKKTWISACAGMTEVRIRC